MGGPTIGAFAPPRLIATFSPALLLALGILFGGTCAANATGDPLQRGVSAFQQGAFADAAVQWEQAAQEYARRGAVTEQISALTHLSRAQSELGQYRRAAASLAEALRLAKSQRDRRLEASAMAALGNVQMALGEGVAAERYLREALVIARELPDSELVAGISNQLGNLLLSEQKYSEALAQYDESIRLASPDSQRLLAARARINAASALREDGRAGDALAMLDQALIALRTLPASHEVAFTQVSAGLGYRDLRPYRKDERNRLTLQASAVLRYAGHNADVIGDRRVSAYAWGYLGGLYEEEQRFSEALELTRTAIFDAQQTNAPESLYLWQWQAGRLLRQMGQVEPAIEAYRRAVETLQSIRPELSVRYGAAPGSFRETTGSVYFELVDLLLQRAGTGAAGEQTGPLLREARQTIELFKVAELRDYFRDDCVDAALSKSTRLDDVAKSAVAIYPVLLPDRTELLVSLPGGLKRIVVDVDRATLTEEVRQFRRKLEKRTTREYLPHARKLYSWLIAPLAADLAQSHVDTLVFVPDGPLRTIPMAALHDGEKFLVAQYALAITPGLNLTDARPIRRDRTRVLAAGVSESVQGFPGLPNVSAELGALRSLFDTTTLENREFVVPTLEQNLKAQPYSILHVASHGEFVGDPAKSFLLTFDGRLSMDRLNEVVGLFRYREDPLELLTLSACETAEGDDRAALGLAGVAVRAGARSAVATLWQVHDAAAAELVTHFYRELRDPGVSRAVALQRAQLRVMSNPRYSHPGYWSPFLLVNSWL